VSALPVVNDQGVLLDIYARSDITKLCKGNAYSRLQWEDVTVRRVGGGGGQQLQQGRAVWLLWGVGVRV